MLTGVRSFLTEELVVKDIVANARLIGSLAIWGGAGLYIALGQTGWMMMLIGCLAFAYGLLTFDRHSTVIKGRFRSNPAWPSVVAVAIGSIGVIRSIPAVVRSIGDWLEGAFGWLAFSPITAIVVVVTILVLVFAGAWLVTRPKKNS